MTRCFNWRALAKRMRSLPWRKAMKAARGLVVLMYWLDKLFDRFVLPS